MPTYTQLTAEPAWRAEYMTDAMTWFCDELAVALGIPRDHVGAKGDHRHLNGGHRSQRWILTSEYCTNRSYTVYPGLPAHLVDALGAIDVTPKSREQMLLICRRLEVAARAGLIEEVVAWYGNTDGDQRVDGWDNVRNAVASSDSSHLWHLHKTINRHKLADRPFWERLLAVLTGRPIPSTAPPETHTQEEDMPRLARWSGSAAVMVCYSDGTARWVRTPGELAALRTLWGCGEPIVVGDAAAVGAIRGPVPDDWPTGELMPGAAKD